MARPVIIMSGWKTIYKISWQSDWCNHLPSRVGLTKGPLSRNRSDNLLNTRANKQALTPVGVIYNMIQVVGRGISTVVNLLAAVPRWLRNQATSLQGKLLQVPQKCRQGSPLWATGKKVHKVDKKGNLSWLNIVCQMKHWLHYTIDGAYWVWSALGKVQILHNFISPWHLYPGWMGYK